MAVMKQALQLWMDRVLYARDPVFNNSFHQIADVVSNEAPPMTTANQTLAGGAIEILGIGPATGKTYEPGAKTDIHVYFRAKTATPSVLRFQLVAWPAGTPGDPVPANAIRSAHRLTADGNFATDRWKPGDRVRERFAITIPADWKGERMVVGLLTTDAQGTEKALPTGPTASNDPNVAILGTLPVTVPPGSSAPPSP
jgi:hypothetical protein